MSTPDDLVARSYKLGSDPRVTIYGGDVWNETVIDLNANAGTAISDASAGSNNAATTGGGDRATVPDPPPPR